MTTFDYEILHTEEQSQAKDLTPKVRSPWRRFLREASTLRFMAYF